MDQHRDPTPANNRLQQELQARTAELQLKQLRQPVNRASELVALWLQK